MRICRKYGVNDRGRVYNLQSGRELPEDEPVLLFRAQDRHLPEVLRHYKNLCQNLSHQQVVVDRLVEVIHWQQEHNVKEPDTDLSDFDVAPECAFEPDPVGDAMDGVLGNYPHKKMDLDDLVHRTRKPEDPSLKSVEVRGPDVYGVHNRVTDVEVDDAGYLRVTMMEGQMAIYNRTEWSSVSWRRQSC